jgi:hypothetical protein
MSRSFKHWSKAEGQKAHEVRENLYRPQKYEKHVWKDVKDFLKVRADAGDLYMSSWKDLDAEKTRLWEKGVQKNWDLDKRVSGLDQRIFGEQGKARRLILPEDTLVVKNLQSLFGYCNTKVALEWRHLMWYTERALVKNCCRFVGETAKCTLGLNDEFLKLETRMNSLGDHIDANEPKFYNDRDWGLLKKNSAQGSG